jgi:hypothetical protein
MLQITEGGIKNGQSRETKGSQDEEKQTKTTKQYVLNSTMYK